MNVHVKTYKAKDKDWRWNMRRAGRIVADSGEGYSGKRGANRSAVRLVDAIKSGKVVFDD